MRKAFSFFLFAFVLSAATFVFAQNPAAQNQNNRAAGDLAQYGIRVEPDKRLILVMATLEAAGIDTPLTATGKKFRQQLRTDLTNIPADLRDKIKTFVELRQKRYTGAGASAQFVAPFVTLAYALNPADFGDPVKTADLPAGLIEILDFAPLVREFYRRSGIEQKLPEYAKLYQAEGDKMRFSTRQMVNDLLGYLHTRPELEYVEKIKSEGKDEKTKKNVQKIETRVHQRLFYVVPEMLVPSGAIYFQNVGDNYYVVVPPDVNLSVSDARRAYLQFLADPLVLKYAKDVLPFRDGIKLLLDERRKTRPEISPDVYLAVSRSLVAAVEAREDEFRKVQTATAEAREKINREQNVEAKKAVSANLAALKQTYADETALRLSEAYESGAVLAFYFADQLKGSEDSGFDIASSLREMILSLAPAKESGRLAQYAEAKTRALASRQVNYDKTLDLPRRLLTVNDMIVGKRYTEAETELKKLLDENPNEPRIYYTLGRISGILAQSDITFDENLRDKRLEDAKVYYSNAIRSANPQTDPALIQLSYVALGRIYEFYDQNDVAMKIYDAAIKIGDVNGGAYREALTAKDKLTKKQ